MTYTATTSTDDIDVTFECDMIQTDLGVPGSPVYLERENTTIAHLAILGVSVDPLKIPDELYDTILELADDLEFYD